MRIAYLHLHPIRPGEAPATHVEGIVTGLRRLGHEVDLFSPVTHGGPLARIRAARAVQAEAVASGADVVYVRQHVFGFDATRSAARSNTGHATPPVVVEVNGGPLDYTMARQWLRPATPLIDRELGRQVAAADGVVAVTQGLADWARAHGAHRTTVIGNAADADVAGADVSPTPPAAAEGRAYVLYFGALAPWQGIRTALAAAARPEWPHDVALVVLGDGALRADVDDAAASLSGRVVHLDPVPRSEVPGIVAGAVATLSVMHDSPRTRLGLSPIKTFESLAVGTPVIASDLPGLADIIADTGGGVTIPADAPTALASVAAELATDADRRAALGKAGRDAVSARHTWDHRAAATADFLAEVVKRR